MKVACIAMTALAVLSLNVEARIGQKRRLEDVELFLEIVGDNGDFDEFPLGENPGSC